MINSLAEIKVGDLIKFDPASDGCSGEHHYFLVLSSKANFIKVIKVGGKTKSKPFDTIILTRKNLPYCKIINRK